MRIIRLIIIALSFITLTAKSQTVIDLNNGGKVHAKTMRDYNREANIKIAREDSIKYADCLKRAYSALHCDSLTEAKQYFKEALALRPKAEGNYIIEQHLGEIAESEGNLPEAEAYYTQILKQHPDLHHIRLSRAVVAVQIHHFNEAKSDCDALLTLSPSREEYSKILFVRATALMGLRLNHEARKDWETLCMLDPKNENASLMLALSLHDEGRSQEALERLNIHLRLNPQSIDALSLRASIHEALHLYDLARIDHDEAIRLAPNNAALYLERAHCLEKLGHTAAAEKDRLTARKLQTQ